jgi:spore coat polysaccharide biosynthesis predicted glycosyltransferase SpsG
MTNVAILFPVGSSSGMGHFRRAGIIYNFLKKKNVKIKKFPLIDINNSSKKKLYINNYFEKIFKLKHLNTVIIDFSSSTVIKQYKNIKKIIFNKAQKKMKKKIIIIDSIKSEKLYNRNCCKRIIPYYLKNHKKLKDGFKYVVVNPKLFEIKKPDFKKILKILITCGGSDMKNTLFVCDQILMLDSDIMKNTNFKIIIGKFCTRSFYKKIKKKFKNFINCQVVYGANDNHNNYLWSDIVICSDGITKYEALASGRYALVIKTSKTNDIYGKDFEKLGLFHFIKRNNNDLRENALNFLNFDNNKNLKNLTKHVNNFKKIYFKMSMNNYYNLIRN